MVPARRPGASSLPLLLAVLAPALAGFAAAALRTGDARLVELAARFAAGLALNGGLAAAAWAGRALTAGGAAAGSVLGATVWAFGDARAFALLAAFVVLGTLATRIGHETKTRAGIAEGSGGRRGAASALAKLTVPTAAAVLSAFAPDPLPWLLAFAGALATSAADTVATEIGKARGGRTVLITTLRTVPRGTAGAISLAGSVAGLAAGAGVAAAGHLLGLYPRAGALAVAAAAAVATALESVAGATLGRRGVLGHDGVNLLDALAGALLAAGAGTWLLRG